MENNDQTAVSPYFRILSEAQIEKIHYATLEVLEHTGVSIENPEAIALLDGAGADVSNPKRVKIPSFLIDKAIRSAPKIIILFTRDGKPFVRLNGNRSYFGATPDMREILDPKTGQARNITIKDVAEVSRLIDALPNMTWIYTTGWAGYHQGVPGDLADRMSFSVALRNTPKPLGCCIQNASNLKDMIDLAATVTGGYDNLRRKPYFWCAVEPVSPLVQGNDAVEKTLICAEYGVPNVGYSMLMGGASAPATFAGILALANAETLTLLLISQLKKEGSPYIYGAIPNIMDMKTAVFTYGSPELSLLVGALTEVSHYYKLPMWGTAGCTDAKKNGLQTGLEVMHQCMMSSFTGADFIHDVGLIANGMQVSPELIVLVDEVIDMIDVFLKGIAVNDAAFALDLIEKVGPGGNFISEEHTFQNFRNFWEPTILDRTIAVHGTEDKKEIHSEALLKEKTIHLLESHEPQRLPEKMEQEIRKVERSWFDRVGLNYDQLSI